ncbi:MAG: gamma-glutamyltransferase [Planctomycetes bacterium]|nr:gamma-glutamyltransferase [Planctomycetota bacterium]MCB9828725.1 gamma-glutamyltransferase [Planctomycetota bacterium]MCB9901089.1 gamma-glutamyltransferase [Planctomycetota bacterium]
MQAGRGSAARPRPGGVCASGDEASAAAGAAVLAEGGTASDAVIAATLVAAVTLPTMTGLGGAALFLVHAGGTTEVLDAFSDVPGRGADAQAVTPPEIVTVPFEEVEVDFEVGPASIAVPGLGAGLLALHERHGRLPLARLAEPAIHAARQGSDVGEGHHRAFALLAEIFRRTPEAWSLVGDEDGPFRPGQRRANVALADTLEALVAEGVAFLRDGDLARGMVAASEGHLTADDLASYRVAWRAPLVGSYRGGTVTAPAGPSVAGAQVLAALAAFERSPPLARHPEPEAVWGLVDALAAAERLRTHELEARRDDVAWLTERVAACRAGNTVHITAADGEGSVVGCTSTLGESAGLVVPGTGVALNNFLGEPDIAPRDRRAAIGHRMMTSMCPVLFQRDGATLGVGSAGSSRIRSAVPQVVVNRVDRGMDLATAIAAPRVHVEDGMLYVEGHGRLRAEVEALLGWPGGASRANWPLGFYFGGAQAVSFDGHGFDGGADVARRGCAVAFA